MNKYAIVKDEEVVNVALWDGEAEWQPDGQIVEVPSGLSVGPGWRFADGQWTAPEREPHDI